jgi:hypothetical protein
VGQVAPDAFLRQAVAAGGVDEVDAEVEHTVQQRAGIGFGDATIVQVHGAEAQRGHAQATAAEVVANHRVWPRTPPTARSAR